MSSNAGPSMFYPSSSPSIDAIDEDALQILQSSKIKENRRLSRLYGVNIKRVASSHLRARPKNNDDDETMTTTERRPHTTASSSSVRPHSNNKKQPSSLDKQPTTTLLERLSEPKTKVAKFKHRIRTPSEVVEMHADNYNIPHPWYVGYQNTATIPVGSPLSIASRYGYGGAIRLTKQCRSGNAHDIPLTKKASERWLSPTLSPNITTPMTTVTQGHIDDGNSRTSSPPRRRITPPTSSPADDEGSPPLSSFLSPPNNWFKNAIINVDPIIDDASQGRWHDRKPRGTRPSTAAHVHAKTISVSKLMRASEREREMWDKVKEGVRREKRELRRVNSAPMTTTTTTTTKTTRRSGVESGRRRRRTWMNSVPIGERCRKQNHDKIIILR